MLAQTQAEVGASPSLLVSSSFFSYPAENLLLQCWFRWNPHGFCSAFHVPSYSSYRLPELLLQNPLLLHHSLTSVLTISYRILSKLPPTAHLVLHRFSAPPLTIPWLPQLTLDFYLIVVLQLLFLHIFFVSLLVFPSSFCSVWKRSATITPLGRLSGSLHAWPFLVYQLSLFSRHLIINFIKAFYHIYEDCHLADPSN